MKRLPRLFQFHTALNIISEQTDVLPAVGGAIEDELRPDADEIQDQETSKDDRLMENHMSSGKAICTFLLNL